MSIYNRYIGKTVNLTISGNKSITGIIIDIGTDIIVVFDGEQFIYIPKVHIHLINNSIDDEEEIKKPKNTPIIFEEETISFRKILTNAKGLFSEVFITSNQSIHGYITNIMNDYFVFYSPVYKMMLIPMQHLKWLIPYKESERPYTLSNEELPLVPINMTLARTFTEQCKKYEGKLVIFDLGKDPNKIGKLVKMDNGQLQLTIERNRNVLLNIQHIKSLHLP
ncbi:DUF2642 domain-containing protein [Fictibacillus phosphorivorans]|uniref:DUF2642 domain-containing protein n=1 Tax=Fictibacillus phosphorivorans TaxID=1221500 RepID=UPI0020425674|nr:DUF2642 domain-containing protein [Fictibacillus phosphorivorans]MCM3718198.1 DUF2642 domain-containing protein [Fictibacillus phosphorivorans]MCM3775935.1 DUF2642 domain-containing protein [Fictibacillus phosphorivorans]